MTAVIYNLVLISLNKKYVFINSRIINCSQFVTFNRISACCFAFIFVYNLQFFFLYLFEQVIKLILFVLNEKVILEVNVLKIHNKHMYAKSILEKWQTLCYYEMKSWLYRIFYVFS